jgi:cytochrome c553
MAYMVQHMSDDYLREIADYFAGLDLPYPPVSPASDATPEVLARGRMLALQGDAERRLPACVQCHGAALTGVQPATPGLLGAAAPVPRLAAGRLAHERAACAGARLHGRGRPAHVDLRRERGGELARDAAGAGQRKAGRLAARADADRLRRGAQVREPRA